jgi:aminopeptidase N
MKYNLYLSILFMILFINNIGFASPSLPEQFIPQPFDVIKYDVKLDLTAYPATDVKGTSTIILNWVNLTDESEFYFHTIGIKPDSVFYNGLKVNYNYFLDEQQSIAYSVKPPKNAAGEDTIKVYFSGTMINEDGPYPWGGVNFDAGVLYNMGVGMFNKEVSAARYWFPCYDHPSDKALFHGTFIVPAGKVLVSNGDLVQFAQPDNGTDVYEWETSAPAATYLLNYALGDFVQTDFEIRKGLKANIYSKISDTLKVKAVFKNLADIVYFGAQYFGAYPFEKVGYVLTEKGSMEHQTLINYAQSVFDDAYKKGDGYDPTLIHELMHQWFGNCISIKDFRDAWLSESFAEFCELLFNEYLMTEKDYFKKVTEEAYQYIYATASNEKKIPLYDFDRTKVGNYPRTIYNKGAAVLAVLRQEIGKTIFDPMMKEYYNTYAYKNLSTKEFIDFVNNYTKSDYNWFFKQWVYWSEYPNITVTVNKEYYEPIGLEIATKVIIDQVQADTALFRHLPIEITFQNKDGSKNTFLYYITEKHTEFDVSGFLMPVKSILVNTGENSVSLLRCSNQKIVGVNDEQSVQPLLIFPNIADSGSEIGLIYNSISYDNLNIEIYNSIGELLNSIPFTVKTGDNSVKIPTENLSAGKYNVLISSKNNTAIGCFIVR